MRDEDATPPASEPVPAQVGHAVDQNTLLRTAVDNLSAMIAYWDSSQRCRLANRAYEKWFRVSPESLIGRHIGELLGPLYALNLPYIEGALRGEAQEFEREIPDPGGGPPRHSLAQYTPDVQDGVVRGFFVLVTDISAVKRAEAALKESEAKFSGIISISADAIISVDEQQRITDFNAGASDIFGYSRTEAIGAPLDILLPERFRASHRQHLERFAVGAVASRRMGERLAMIAGRRKNGEEFPAEAAISRLPIGGKTLLTVALRDVTERDRAEKEQRLLAEAGATLAASLDYEQTLATVARLVVRDHADWCMVELLEDREHPRRVKVVSADPAKAALCAVLEEVPIETSRPRLISAVFETKRPLLIERVTPEMLESAAQGKEHLQALRDLNPSSLMALPLLARGEILGVIVFVSSSPTRAYRQEDLRMAEALADRASLAIENARLYRASVRATQLRDEVLGIVAHDLRNPLGAITLQAQLLRRRGGQPERRSSGPGEAIERSAARMNRLLQDILNVTRIEAGHLSVVPELVQTRQLVSDCLEAQRALASSESLELLLDVAGDLPAVWADRDRVLQVFENLIGNAVKFTRPGGRITIGAAARDGEVLFWVADTGPGIAAAELPRLFDRFWRAKRTDRRGAGLGLSIAKGIVVAHGGRIWVESELGFGTTFYFTLPTTPPVRAPPDRSELR